MKSIIKKIVNSLGYDIKKIQKQDISIKSNQLSYYETSTGNYFLPTDAAADIVANTIKQGKIFEKEVVELAAKYIKKNTAVLDVGANFGQMSILFSNMVGETGVVYAFDADDFVYDILKKNVDANNRKNIIPIFGAVHNVLDEILLFPVQDFVEYPAYGAYGIDYTATSGREVKSLTIDSIEINMPVSFMKIDIQGGDLQAMQGAINTIQRNRMPILFEYEYHFEEKYQLVFQEYVDFVQSIKYKFSKVINGHNYLILPEEWNS